VVINTGVTFDLLNVNYSCISSAGECYVMSPDLCYVLPWSSTHVLVELLFLLEYICVCMCMCMHSSCLHLLSTPCISG
jgi:hypothetical protein